MNEIEFRGHLQHDLWRICENGNPCRGKKKHLSITKIKLNGQVVLVIRMRKLEKEKSKIKFRGHQQCAFSYQKKKGSRNS